MPWWLSHQNECECSSHQVLKGKKFIAEAGYFQQSQMRSEANTRFTVLKVRPIPVYIWGANSKNTIGFALPCSGYGTVMLVNGSSNFLVEKLIPQRSPRKLLEPYTKTELYARSIKLNWMGQNQCHFWNQHPKFIINLERRFSDQQICN